MLARKYVDKRRNPVYMPLDTYTYTYRATGVVPLIPFATENVDTVYSFTLTKEIRCQKRGSICTFR